MNFLDMCRLGCPVHILAVQLDALRNVAEILVKGREEGAWFLMLDDRCKISQHAQNPPKKSTSGGPTE